jgi:hypothetical protein
MYGVGVSKLHPEVFILRIFNVHSAVNKRGKATTPLGAYHGSDILIWFPPDAAGETTSGVDAMGM